MPRATFRNRSKNSRCGAQNGRWKGGRISDGNGYVQILLEPSHKYYQMTNARDYVLEHRLVMAQHLGRCLGSWECVHHKDGNKANNRIPNLELLQTQAHNSASILKKQVSELQKRIMFLERALESVSRSLPTSI